MKIGIAGEREEYRNYVAVAEGLGHSTVTGLSVPDFSCCDFLILPGGEDLCPDLYGEEMAGSVSTNRELDKAQLALLDEFVKTRRPVLGICRGHQMINVYFGGSLIQDIFPNPIHREQEKKGEDVFHPVMALGESFFRREYGERFVVNSFHHQGVKKLGEGLVPLLVAEDGINEAFCHESLPICGVQFHPERMCLEKRRLDTADMLPFFTHLFQMKNRS